VQDPTGDGTWDGTGHITDCGLATGSVGIGIAAPSHDTILPCCTGASSSLRDLVRLETGHSVLGSNEAYLTILLTLCYCVAGNHKRCRGAVMHPQAYVSSGGHVRVIGVCTPSLLRRRHNR